MPLRSLHIATVFVALSLPALTVACSSDSPSSSDTTAATSPEDLRASDADVATGLRKLVTTSQGIADKAGKDDAAAQALIDDIEPTWQPVEGTVKANDPDTYLTFEDAFALLERSISEKDPALAEDGAGDIASATDTYLGAHPG